MGVDHLDDVGSIGLSGTFTSISGRVLVTSCPLEVDVVTESDVEILWNEVVFGGGVGLDNVSSLSLDVEIVNSGNTGNSMRSLSHDPSMRSVLEGSSELRGIRSHFELGGGVGVRVVSADKWVLELN